MTRNYRRSYQRQLSHGIPSHTFAIIQASIQAARWIRTHAQQHQLTPELYALEVRKHLRALLTSTDLYIRVTQKRLETLLSTGGVPVLADITGKISNGRALAELLLLNQHVDEVITYGYFAEGPNDNDLVKIYGGAALRVRPELRSKSTFIYGDVDASLPRTWKGQKIDFGSNSHVDSPVVAEIINVLIEQWEQNQERTQKILLESASHWPYAQVPSSPADPSELSWNWDSKEDPLLVGIGRAGCRSLYLEAHIYDRVWLADIETVCVPDSWPATLTDRLREAGLAVEVENHYRTLPNVSTGFHEVFQPLYGTPAHEHVMPEPRPTVGVDPGTVRTELEARFTLGPSSIHGPQHWARVEAHAVRLAQATGGDLEVVRWFAVFHDAARVKEAQDHGHGERAAVLVMQYRPRLPLTDLQMELLAEACRAHEMGYISTDPTIGACWDADRLELVRVGIIPSPGLMSTAAGQRDAAALAAPVS